MITNSLLRMCVIVFLARIVDVSMATFRTVLTVKGKTVKATCIAFFETLIWFLMIKEALNVETNSGIETMTIALAYAGGYAAGTFIGGMLSKQIETTIQVQVVSSKKDMAMIKTLQDTGYELTLLSTEATQFAGEKYIIISAITNKQLKAFKSLVYHLDPKAFISISEAKSIFYAPIPKATSNNSK